MQKKGGGGRTGKKRMTVRTSAEQGRGKKKEWARRRGNGGKKKMMPGKEKKAKLRKKKGGNQKNAPTRPRMRRIGNLFRCKARKRRVGPLVQGVGNGRADGGVFALERPKRKKKKKTRPIMRPLKKKSAGPKKPRFPS